RGATVLAQRGAAGQEPGAVPTLPDLRPRGRLGFALSCRRCGWAREAGDWAPYWESVEPPTVHAVEPDGPAARAGLAPGDVVTHVNGAGITTRQGGRALGAVQPQERLRLRVLREEVAREIHITAGTYAALDAMDGLRYRGNTGSAEVVVRGGAPVQVTQQPGGGTITITVGGATVIVRDARSASAPLRDP
ncbi:MAG: PDZ domain-containing protein, partial [Gemmatimonadaceae bacterium]